MEGLAPLLEKEFGFEVVASSEGWGAWYEPSALPLLEAWAGGELEEVPPQLKKPLRVAFYKRALKGKEESFALSFLRHEVNLLLETPFHLWRYGQQEAFRAGHTPTSFLVLFAPLEHARLFLSSKKPLKKEPLLEKVGEAPFPHQRLSLCLFLSLLGENCPFKEKEEAKKLLPLAKEYASLSEPSALYELLSAHLWQAFRPKVKLSEEVCRMELLKEEKRRKRTPHGGRIMTDVLSKLPPSFLKLLDEKPPEELRASFSEAVKGLPSWMSAYLREMAYARLLEEELSFLSYFFPPFLEREVEHRGFVRFLFKGLGGGKGRGSSAGGKGLFASLFFEVREEAESLKRALKALLPEEEEGWEGNFYGGRKINGRRLSLEVALRRGKLFMRKRKPEKRGLLFGLLLDASASMKKEEKIKHALKGVLLTSQVLKELSLPFSVYLFNERFYPLKEASEPPSLLEGKLKELPSLLGGGTDLGLALEESVRRLLKAGKETGYPPLLLLFTDGVPTRGVRGEELKELVGELSRKVPLVALCVGSSSPSLKEYFGKRAVEVPSFASLPFYTASVVAKRLKRLNSFS